MSAKTWKIITIVIVVLIAVPVAGVSFLFHWFTGDNAEEHAMQALDRVWTASVDDETREQVEANEAEVLGTLVMIRDGQIAHKRKHGRYAEFIHELSLPPELMASSFESMSESGYHGYKFGPIPTDGALEMNHISHYTFCAVPALYRMTGVHTFAIEPDGAIHRKDTWGAPVENTVDLLDASWEVVSAQTP